MKNHNKTQDKEISEEAKTASFRWRVQFSPHVIVFLLTLWAAIPALKGVIISGVFLWWDDSYKMVEFVMDEARPNEGYPYIAGHLEGSTEQRNLIGLMQGTTMVVKAAPQEAFAPGKRIFIWHSETAPSFLVFGGEVNDVPVASLPERPGLFYLLLHLVWLYVTFLVGFRLMAWVAMRWSRSYGNLPARRRR
jgi:hypothetical protein